MHRTLSAWIAVVAVGAAGSAPRLKDLPGYYPTTVGDRWVMEMRSGTSTSEYTEVVTDVEKKDGALIVTVGRETEGKVSPQLSRMKVTDKGLFRMSNLGTTFDSPYCVLKLPLKTGDTWTSEAGSRGGSVSTLKYKVAKEDEVEVPAGKYRTFRIEVDMDTSGTVTRASIWYAPNVGVVKQEYQDPDAGYVKVLKSFKPGK